MKSAARREPSRYQSPSENLYSGLRNRPLPLGGPILAAFKCDLNQTLGSDLASFLVDTDGRQRSTDSSVADAPLQWQAD